MTTRENDITESFTGDRMSILNEIAARTKERIAASLCSCVCLLQFLTFSNLIIRLDLT